MVVKDGVVYFPSELYPRFGIRPFSTAPSVQVPQAEAAFDPTLSFEGQYQEGRPPFFTSNPFAGLPPGLIVSSSDNLALSTNLTKRFFTGTTVRAFWNENRQKTENVLKRLADFVDSQLRLQRAESEAVQ